MGIKLVHIEDWPTEARNADYELKTLAKRLGISPSQIQRVIQREFRVSAKTYLRALRVNHGLDELMIRRNIKEAAGQARYKTRQHFAREFEYFIGLSPTAYLRKLQS